MTTNEASEKPPVITITINGREVECQPGELVIDAAERSGTYIPRFCYHPRMKPVGMCRMCLVDVDSGRGPGLQPSCMIQVSEGMSVDTESERTQRAQEGILELLLVNHPLDCPVCDKGGECPLQDQTVAYGPGESRFIEEKRHYEKPIPISDLVYLDRERCILCDRCTRFASDVAGDPLIHFIDRGNETQVNTFPDEPFSSYFSGNTVQICPVGALTAEPYRFKARPWDLAEVESTATVDSTGARVVVQSSRDSMVRVLGVDSDAVNWSWLSDKDRFAYESANSDGRVLDPLVRNESGEFNVARWSDASSFASEALSVEPSRIGVIGGARLPIEGQFAWRRLLDAAGVANIDAQLGDGIDADIIQGLPRATIAEAAAPGGVVVLLSADPKEELPTLYLRLRHAAIEDGAAIIEMTPGATGLNRQAAVSLHPLPGSVAEVATALADGQTGAEVGGVDAASLAAAAELINSGRPVTIVFGRQNLAENESFVTAAASALARMAPEARFLPALRRGNVHGAIELGLTPSSGLETHEMLQACANDEIDTLVLLGADPLADFPDRSIVDAAFDHVENVIAIDTFLNQSSSRADLVLPAAGFGEVDGSFLNLERRLSPLRAKVTPPGQARADWMIAAELGAAIGHDLGFATIDELRTELSATVPSFTDVDWADLDSAGDGPVLPTQSDAGVALADIGSASTVAVPPRDGYGLRLVVDRKLWDLGTMVQQSVSLAHLPAPAELSLSTHDFEALGVADGAEVTVASEAASATLAVRHDAGLPRGAARIPYLLPGFDAGRLLAADQPVIDVRVSAG